MCAWRAKAMSTPSERILGAAGGAGTRAWPLFDAASTRALEASHRAPPDGPTLMQSAGLALARLSLALVPHARLVWLACGPGNNGGDGLQAAAHLQRWGKPVVACLVHDPKHCGADAQAAWQAAQAAGVQFTRQPPAQYDLCIDALFGIGRQRPLQAPYADWVHAMNAHPAPTLAVDIPSGLDADTGTAAALHVRAQHTLCLLALKPGLFTGSGRDACGEVWFDGLGVVPAGPPKAWLQAAPLALARPHASHKGSYGDVAIVGGAAGMAGAALLAARAALQGGAGRVFVCPLDPAATLLDNGQPELMFRPLDALNWQDQTLVVGCGGGEAVAAVLPDVLQRSQRLVLDADALNAIAKSTSLQTLLAQRPAGSTVLTPHPLEAARLLGSDTAQVQSQRLLAAQTLAERFHCVVVLKGSGTVVAAQSQILRINPTGNARLATAGTGDVLAGLLGAYWAGGMAAVDAACAAVYRHGLAAEVRQGLSAAGTQGPMLTASTLCQWV